MAGLGDFFGGVQQWTAPRRNALLGLGSDLLSGDFGGRVVQGRAMDDANAIRAKEEAARTAQINQTAQWLQQNYPQFAGLPPDQGFQAAMKALSQQQTADAESFFGTPLFTQDEAGNLTVNQLGNRGTLNPLELPPGETLAPPTKEVDTGTEIITFDRFGNELFRTPKQNQQAAFDTALGSGQGKQAAELPQAQAKATTALSGLEAKSQVALNAVDKALEQVNWATSGMASVTAGVPGTPAHDLAKTLQTIMANIGFEELQTMRDNSPTGGALGQVSERELAFLQSTITNIQQSQSEQQLKENLQILREYLAGSQERRRAAFQQQFGGGGQQAPAGNSTSTGIQWSIEP